MRKHLLKTQDTRLKTCGAEAPAQDTRPKTQDLSKSAARRLPIRDAIADNELPSTNHEYEYEYERLFSRFRAQGARRTAQAASRVPTFLPALTCGARAPHPSIPPRLHALRFTLAAASETMLPAPAPKPIAYPLVSLAVHAAGGVGAVLFKLPWDG